MESKKLDNRDYCIYFHILLVVYFIPLSYWYAYQNDRKHCVEILKELGEEVMLLFSRHCLFFEYLS